MVDLTCQRVSDFLMAYLDRELDAETHARFEAHLAECEECVRYLRDYQATVRLARKAYADLDERDRVPERLVKAILAARKT
jgi:anti-sigma factor RsiW